jgi:hypothetical protein
VTPAGLASNRTWAASVALVHDWSPALRIAAFAIRSGQDAPAPFPTVRIGTVGATLAWSPVRGGQVAAELARQAITTSRAGWDVPPGGTSRSAWVGRIRLQQDF